MNKRSKLHINYEYYGDTRWKLGNYIVNKFANHWTIEGVNKIFESRGDMEDYILSTGKDQVINELKYLGLNLGKGHIAK